MTLEVTYRYVSYRIVAPDGTYVDAFKPIIMTVARIEHWTRGWWLWKKEWTVETEVEVYQKDSRWYNPIEGYEYSYEYYQQFNRMLALAKMKAEYEAGLDAEIASVDKKVEPDKRDALDRYSEMLDKVIPIRRAK